MSETMFLGILAFLGGGGAAAIITALFNRRKTSADATKIITDATKEILGEYRKRNDESEKELSDLKRLFRELDEAFKAAQVELAERDKRYRQEQALQDKAIENTNAKVLRLELLNVIYVSQIRSLGVEPIIEPREFNSISVDDLRSIARSLSDIEAQKSRPVVIAKNLGGNDDQ